MMNSIVYELTAPYALKATNNHLNAANCGSRQLCAETVYTVISPGTEFAAWSGKKALRDSQQYPRVVGYCNLAKVISVGADVTSVAPGAYILTHQSHRSSFICGEDDVILSLNSIDGVLLKKLTATYLYHLGYTALLSGDYKPGNYVAIVGAGVLGLSAAQLLKAFGATPLLFTDQSLPGDGRHVFAKSEIDFQQISEITGMDGVDIVINTSNSWQDYLLSLQVARKGGKVVCLGFPGRDDGLPDFNPFDPSLFYDKQLSVASTGGYSRQNVEPIEQRFTLKRNMHFLAGLITDGKIDPSILINKEFKWDKLEAIYDALGKRDRDFYSALLTWNNEE